MQIELRCELPDCSETAIFLVRANVNERIPSPDQALQFSYEILRGRYHAGGRSEKRSSRASKWIAQTLHPSWLTLGYSHLELAACSGAGGPPKTNAKGISIAAIPERCFNH